MRFFRPTALVLLAVAGISSAGAAQTTPAQPRQLTAEDYARAERMLAANTAPLVTGLVARPTWLGDGRVRYRTGVRTRSAF